MISFQIDSKVLSSQYYETLNNIKFTSIIIFLFPFLISLFPYSRYPFIAAFRNIFTNFGMAKRHEAILPSEMTEDEYIYLPSDKEDFEEVTYRMSGKWLIYSMELSQQDRFWEALLPLYHQGLILGLKASTAKGTKAQTVKDTKDHIIMCYTEDSDDKRCVKNTADAIRAAIGVREKMYYKTNAASIDGLYTHEGHKGVCKYMHTYQGELLERDIFKNWKTVSFDHA